MAGKDAHTKTKPATAEPVAAAAQARHQDGEGRQRHLRGHDGRNLGEGLGSVTTSFGGFASDPSSPASSPDWHASAAACASRRSHRTICWGRMMRPFGADESMGITSTTTSPGFAKSAMTRLAGFAWPAAAATDSLSSRTFVPVAALTAIFRTMAPREA